MHKSNLTVLVLFGVIALMFLQLPPMVAKQDTVLNTYRALVEVDALAHQRYIAGVQEDELVQGAIRGMMDTLDPYSGYLSPKELPSYMRRSYGTYVGIGVELGAQDGRIIVIAPFDDSPASRAGILAGDELVSVDGMDLKSLSVFDVTEMLVGSLGTSVAIKLRRPADSEIIELTIPRAPVEYLSVAGCRRTSDGAWDYELMQQERIGYIRVTHFRENTIEEFDKAINEITSAGLTALILDLRFNPGGLLDQAVTLVDRFVDEGLIVSTVSRRNALRAYHGAPSATRLPDIPLVLLINEWSASSAEIVAGALQDLKRATLVGDRSFGKGSVQHLIHLTTHPAAIKLTVAYYRLPSGRLIHRKPDHSNSDPWGVQPDIRVEISDEESTAIQTSRRLVDHLETAADTGTRTDNNVDATTATGAAGQEIIIDRQLARAIEFLRDGSR